MGHMEPSPDDPPIVLSLEERTASFKVLSSFVDIESSAPIRSAIAGVIGSEAVDRVIIDLENVEYMDATGLGVMVGALKRLRNNNQSLLLRNTVSQNSCSVQRILELTGLDGVFEIENPTPKDDSAQ